MDYLDTDSFSNLQTWIIEKKLANMTYESIIENYKSSFPFASGNLIEEVFNTVPFSHIFNVDETFWRLCQSGDYTWAPTGSTNVTINTQDEKAGFTTVCTIGANGEKYQPILISIGTTEQCERN